MVSGGPRYIGYQRSPRPLRVTWLIQMTVLSMLLHIAGSVVSIATILSPDTREFLRQQWASQGVALELLDDDFFRASMVSSALGNIVVGLLITSGFVVVIFGLHQRWRWSRWLGLVIVASFTVWNAWLLAPFGGGDLVPSVYGTLSVIIGAVFLFVNICWLILAFNRTVNAWLC